MSTKKEDALVLAEELLSDIELTRINPVSTVRKASRLARLMDDVETMAWLSYEISGYPSKGGKKGLPSAEWDAAGKSGRRYLKTVEGKEEEYANCATIGSLQAIVDSATIRLQNSDSSNIYERSGLQTSISDSMAIIDKIVGAIHQYVAEMYQELRFGAAVESAFQALRNRVDGEIASLVPSAMPMLTTALENAHTDNPEQWKNAAKACRDLIKATADELRPPGPDKKGIKMNATSYINRLVDWIQENSSSGTKRDLIKTDLEHLGKRLDAVVGSGNKGAHTDVTKDDAGRYIIGTYIFLGDILELANQDQNA